MRTRVLSTGFPGAQVMCTGLWLLVLVLLFLLPLLLMVLQSLSVGWSYPDILPDRLGLIHWMRLLSRRGLAASLAVSALYSLMALVLSVILCLPAARTLAFLPSARRPWKRVLLEALLMSPIVLPPVGTALGNHMWMSGLGLSDNIWAVALMLAFYSYPYLLRSLTIAYRITGRQILDAADNLGASPLQRLLRLELPLLLPALLSGGGIVFLAAYSDYFVLSLFGGGLVRGLPLELVPLIGSSDRSAGAVMTMVFLIPPLVVLGTLELVLERRLLRRQMK